MRGLSQWDNLMATMTSLSKTIFPSPFESQSFLTRGNWLPINFELAVRKTSIKFSFISANISIFDVEMIFLKQIIFYFKEFMLR